MILVMKRLIIIISAFIALVACNKEMVENTIDNTSIEHTREIKVNLSINRTDDFASAKATVKTSWVNGDVVFVFFKGIAAPKYLEMKFNGSSWVATAKNSLSPADLLGAADKKMTAIYLPYASDATVANDGGSFVFSGITYCGYFLMAEQVSYTYDTELNGILNLSAPSPSSSGDKHVHFDITGYNSSHAYVLVQKYVKPIIFTSISSEGIVSHTEGTVGEKITGYNDSANSIMSFSGILDASAVGATVDYQFSIADETSSVIYIRDAGTKTLSDAKYIGIGSINDGSKWTSTPYVDLGLSVKWAISNLGTNNPTQVGNLFAWGETITKGSFSLANYAFFGGAMNKYSKYTLDAAWSSNPPADYKYTLEPEDDAATVSIGGCCRMPTPGNFSSLLSNCTLTWTDNYGGTGTKGVIFTSKVAGYTSNSIFLPVVENTAYQSIGRYWTNAIYSGETALARNLWFDQNLDEDTGMSYMARYAGNPIRPVFVF